MSNSVFRIDNPEEYRKAGPEDLIRSLPVPGGHPLFIPKKTLEKLVCGVAKHEFIHLSGPTGTAKSSLIEALHREPRNFRLVCKALGYDVLPIKVYSVEMVTYETPGELYERRSLKDGSTYDEKSMLVRSLEKAKKIEGKCYPVIWIREMGRVHTASVQGGLLNLMTADDIILANGTRINGCGIAWIADSNYQAQDDSTHTLVTFDDALKRRLAINITMDYLSPEQEADVLKHIFQVQGNGHKIMHEIINKVVKLGNDIRQERAKGNLQSLPPPSIWGYMAFIRMATNLPHFSLREIAMSTMLGNASSEDREKLKSTFANAFKDDDSKSKDDPTKAII
ncbi:ATP-binding protein [bacterium]|nr:ATP-binding protein [bacterium]